MTSFNKAPGTARSVTCVAKLSRPVVVPQTDGVPDGGQTGVMTGGGPTETSCRTLGAPG